MLTFNQRAIDELENQAAKRLLRAMDFFQVEHMNRVGISNPRPYLNSSRPGEYLKKRTGAHQAGVLYWPTTIKEIRDNGFKGKIGLLQNVWYGLYQEIYQQRLGFQRTATDLQGRLKAILETPA